MLVGLLNHPVPGINLSWNTPRNNLENLFPKQNILEAYKEKQS